MKPHRNFQLLVLTLAILMSISVGQAQDGKTAAQLMARAESLNNRGIEMAEARKIAEAAKLFQEAIRLRPDYAVAYGNLGKAFYYARQFPEAIAALKKAIELKLDYAEVYNNLGAINIKSDRNNEAAALLERAVVFR
jgi:Flp pilus assembly protein TadD